MSLSERVEGILSPLTGSNYAYTYEEIQEQFVKPILEAVREIVPEPTFTEHSSPTTEQVQSLGFNKCRKEILNLIK